MAKSPIKFGLGEYDENEPFTLKSGNTPIFKRVGSSPYNQTSFVPKTDPSTTAGTDIKKENKDIIVKGGGKRTTGQMVGEAITAGLDSIYHTGKVRFDNTVKIAKDKEEIDKSANTISENLLAVDNGGTDDNGGGNGDGTDYSGYKSVNDLVAERKRLEGEGQKDQKLQDEINKRLKENPNKWD